MSIESQHGIGSQNVDSVGVQEEEKVVVARESILNKLEDFNIITSEERKELESERVDELLSRCTDDLMRLRADESIYSSAKFRRMLGLTRNNGEKRPEISQRKKEIQQTIGDMRLCLRECEKLFPGVLGFVLGGSIMDSGKIPAAIHLSPEASAGGALAKVRNGDIIRLNAAVGTLNVLVDEDTWAEREVEELSDSKRHNNSHGIGRELFGGMRRNVLSAEEGAITWL